MVQVQGTGFLYKQVRHMTGALLAVGESRMELQDISRRLEVGNNQAPGGSLVLYCIVSMSIALQHTFQRALCGSWQRRRLDLEHHVMCISYNGSMLASSPVPDDISC